MVQARFLKNILFRLADRSEDSSVSLGLRQDPKGARVHEDSIATTFGQVLS